MAERRMFAKSIMKSDAFLDLPATAQMLYIQLSLEADDDGFMSNAKSIMRMCACSDDDMNALREKNFIISFPNGVIVITHWKMHNYIPKDRYKKTVHKKERAELVLDESGAYRFVDELYTDCIHDVDIPNTQDRIIKDSLDKDSLGKSNTGEKRIDELMAVAPATADDGISRAVDAWNALGLKSLTVLPKGSKRERLLRTRIDEYGIDNVMKAIANVRASPFLMGQTKDAFNCTFDWLIDAKNLPKVLDGNYMPKTAIEKPAEDLQKRRDRNADLIRLYKSGKI